MFGRIRGFRAVMLAVAGGFLASCGSSARQEPPPTLPERVDRLGEIEVAIHSRHERSANYDRNVAYESWSLRWRGEPLVIDSFGGMWLDEPMRTGAVNAVFVVGSGTHPDLVVNVGDPNNASVFHLLRQDGGKLTAPLLCRTFGADNAVRVLDGKDADKVFQGPHYQSLAGTRRLLLGGACIYDAASRAVLAIPAKPKDVHLPSFVRAMAVSPDGRAFARVGMTESQDPVMMVADLDGGAWSRLPIDTQRMRFPHIEEIDAAWISHHFQWRRGPDGRDRLAERVGFKPLPRRGRYLVNSPQYNVPNLQADQTETFTSFLAGFPKAKRLPDYRYEYSGQVNRLFEIEQENVVVMPDGFYVSRSGQPYWPGQPGDPKLQDLLIHRLGDAFDAELAAGRHDAMFVAPPE